MINNNSSLKKKGSDISGTDKILSEHFRELKSVVLSCLIVLFVIFAIVYLFFGNELIDLISVPIQNRNIDIIYTSLAEAMLMKIKVSLSAAIVVSFPFFVFRIWSFVKDGLYPEERKAITPLFFGMLILFVLGILFSYFVIFSFAVDFLIQEGGDNLQPMLSIKEYVGFLFGFVVPFGIAFEMPIVIAILVRLGIIASDTLKSCRKFIYLAIVIASAILTPPDVISQLCMAGPMMVLFELSVLIAKRIEKKRDAEE